MEKLIKGFNSFDENKKVARKGGNIAGGARKKLEKESGKLVSNKENYLDVPQSIKRIKKN